MDLPSDLAELDEQLDATGAASRAVAAGLDERLGGWRAAEGTWSVAECLDHLAVADRVYLDAMRGPAQRALEQRRLRRGPARPGVIGRWFVRTMEPSDRPRVATKAPALIRPRSGPALSDALAAFLAAHDDVRAFLRTYATVDLAGVRFPNPFIRGVRFSLATGLHVIAAHERRHLAQARRVRAAAEAHARER